MFIDLIRRAEGEVRVRVKGACLERFLNLCVRQGIEMRCVRRCDWNILKGVFSVRDFKRLCPYMGRTGCRVHILSRRGGPFVLRHLKRRTVLTGGLVALGICFYLLATRLWLIELVAPAGVSSVELSRELDALGVHIGMPLKKFDAPTLQRRLILNMDSLSYVTFNRIGNHLIVEVQPTEELLPRRDEEAIESIVARESGVITDITVENGEALHKVGDTVTQGEKLVDALMQPYNEQGTPRLTHAIAKVQARTWHTETAVRPLGTTAKRYTGSTKTQFALIVGRRRINLYFGSGISGVGCDKIVTMNKLKVREGLVLPVELVRQTYTLWKPLSGSDTAETLSQELSARALERLAGRIQGTVTSHEVQVTEENGAARITLQAECSEEIGERIADPQELPAPKSETEGTQ